MSNLFCKHDKDPALCISVAAFYISYRKDTYQVRLELKRSNVYKDFLTIVNDSVNSLQIQSIGILKSRYSIKWHETCDCSQQNKTMAFPIKIEGHLAFEASLEQENTPHAYCVQLPCGRTFIINHSLNKNEYIYLYLCSLLSRITRGRKGFAKSYAHLNKYGVK